MCIYYIACRPVTVRMLSSQIDASQLDTRLNFPLGRFPLIDAFQLEVFYIVP